MFTGNKDTDTQTLLKLDDQSIASVCRVNRYLNSLCTSQDFRRQLIKIRFPYLPDDILLKYKGNQKWSEYYIKDLRLAGISRSSNANKLLLANSEIGRLDKVMIAANRGADIHNQDDLTVRLASANGHLETVKYLVSLGADIHAYNDLAIRWASLNGHTDVVEYLVGLGANIHAQDDMAVQLASQTGHLETVKYLVSVGANIHAENDDAVKLANYNGHTDVVEYLISLGAPDPR